MQRIGSPTLRDWTLARSPTFCTDGIVGVSGTGWGAPDRQRSATDGIVGVSGTGWGAPDRQRFATDGIVGVSGTGAVTMESRQTKGPVVKHLRELLMTAVEFHQQRRVRNN